MKPENEVKNIVQRAQWRHFITACVTGLITTFIVSALGWAMSGFEEFPPLDTGMYTLGFAAYVLELVVWVKVPTEIILNKLCKDYKERNSNDRK